MMKTGAEIAAMTVAELKQEYASAAATLEALEAIVTRDDAARAQLALEDVVTKIDELRAYQAMIKATALAVRS